MRTGDTLTGEANRKRPSFHQGVASAMWPSPNVTRGLLRILDHQHSLRLCQAFVKVLREEMSEAWSAELLVSVLERLLCRVECFVGHDLHLRISRESFRDFPGGCFDRECLRDRAALLLPTDVRLEGL